MKTKEIERKNKILALILTIIAIISVLGAVIWFKMYALVLLP